MRRSPLILFALTVFAGWTFLFAEIPFVRVRILNTEDTIRLTSVSKLFVYDDEENRITLRGEREFSIRAEADELRLYDDKERELIDGVFLRIVNGDKNIPVGIKQVPFGIGWFWEGKED
ncbi:MAG: hypothetical protein JXR21_05615, partial [Candidatus Marinimicrobia bacterium]|nr:hypothetical protein [Candidatus Neomarinimicrobiota bacterium]